MLVLGLLTFLWDIVFSCYYCDIGLRLSIVNIVLIFAHNNLYLVCMAIWWVAWCEMSKFFVGIGIWGVGLMCLGLFVSR